LSLRNDSGILGVVQPAFREAKAWQEPEVEVLSDLQISNHVEVKTRAIKAFNTDDGVTENKIFTTKRRVPAGVEPQGKTKVELLVLEIVEVVVVPSSKLGIGGGREQCKKD